MQAHLSHEADDFRKAITGMHGLEQLRSLHFEAVARCDRTQEQGVHRPVLVELHHLCSRELLEVASAHLLEAAFHFGFGEATRHAVECWVLLDARVQKGRLEPRGGCGQVIHVAWWGWVGMS